MTKCICEKNTLFDTSQSITVKFSIDNTCCFDINRPDVIADNTWLSLSDEVLLLQISWTSPQYTYLILFFWTKEAEKKI